MINISNFNFESYELEKLNNGEYGTIYCVNKQNRSDKNIVIKILNKYKIDRFDKMNLCSSALTEITNLSSIHKCKFITNIHEIYFNDNNIGFSMLKYKYSLDKIIKLIKLTSENIRNITFNITYALTYAQSKNIVHRDLKLQNIMIDDNFNAYVGDWGLSTMINHIRIYDKATEIPIIQTVSYRAPEYLLRYYPECKICGSFHYIGSNESINYCNCKTYIKSVDSWSLGVIILEMYACKKNLLYNNKCITTKDLVDNTLQIILQLINKPKDGVIKNEIDKCLKEYKTDNKIIEYFTKYDIDIECRKFIMNCLQWYPEDRLSPYELLNQSYINNLYIENEQIEHNDILNIDNVDEYIINVDDIIRLNPYYLDNRLYILSKYHEIVNNYNFGLSDYIMMVYFTDKFMSYKEINLNEIKIKYLICAISNMVSSIQEELFFTTSTFINILNINNFNTKYVKNYICEIVSILKFPLAQKTFAHYKIELIGLDNQILILFDYLSLMISKNLKYLKYKSRDIFGSLLLEIKLYSYSINDEIIYYKNNDGLEQLIDKYVNNDLFININIENTLRDINCNEKKLFIYNN